MENLCFYCNNKFIVNNTGGKKQIYCSIKCRNKQYSKTYKDKLIKIGKLGFNSLEEYYSSFSKKNCPICNTDFIINGQNKIYCSRKCKEKK